MHSLLHPVLGLCTGLGILEIGSQASEDRQTVMTRTRWTMLKRKRQMVCLRAVRVWTPEPWARSQTAQVWRSAQLAMQLGKLRNMSLPQSFSWQPVRGGAAADPWQMVVRIK